MSQTHRIIFADYPEAVDLTINLRTIIIFDGKAGKNTFCHCNSWNNAFSSDHR